MELTPGKGSNTVWCNSYGCPGFGWHRACRRLPVDARCGYQGLLAIDAGNSGQDSYHYASVNYAKQVLAADPLHNLCFSIHDYGGNAELVLCRALNPVYALRTLASPAKVFPLARRAASEGEK